MRISGVAVQENAGIAARSCFALNLTLGLLSNGRLLALLRPAITGSPTLLSRLADPNNAATEAELTAPADD